MVRTWGSSCSLTFTAAQATLTGCLDGRAGSAVQRAYQEPADLAFALKRDVDLNYDQMTLRLLNMRGG